MKIIEYLVVGSGCSGAVAAETLVNKGARVTMLDTGIEKSGGDTKVPDKDFLSIRKTDDQQYKYLIGSKAAGVGWGDVGKGEQITPPRKHILQDVEKYIPIDSNTFSPLESLGYGGLGIGWGLQCWEYSQADIKAAGLDTKKMSRGYQVVADRIGISATDDDAGRYTIGDLKNYQPSPAMDRNHQYILSKYAAKKTAINQAGFYLGRTPLSLITKDKDRRKAYAYQDMDFYSDNGQSAWRPWMTVNQLKKQPNFEYLGGYLVTGFKELDDHTEVYALNLKDQSTTTFRCRRLVLATSALGSGRIVLRSLGSSSDRLPLLCNPYSYVPCVQPRFLGQAAEPKKLGFTQLSLFMDKQGDNQGASVASLYSYQSLMLFRIIRHVPLDFKDARVLMQYLTSSLVIMGIHHPDTASKQKYLQLNTAQTPTGDILKIGYKLNKRDAETWQAREKEFMAVMRKMGTYGLKRVDPGMGASIHYAGTLPYSTTKKRFSLHKSGRLHGTRSIYIADSSGFQYLPAPGLTFSLMANAHNVAESAFLNE